MQSPASFDRAAVALSVACVAHCMVLPVIAISMPFLAASVEAEWVHWTLAAFATFASTSVIMHRSTTREPSFLVPAVTGMILIIAALFGESFGIDETLPTVFGGILLATAHIRRLIGKQPH
ncbi:MerC domain-containing protein [Pontixanthobacter sp. CEM42]|uniref:MerC domain-containing protein n=1 Tax=Pontixanthobacter sp. CEM42 TaxID=2792077 RepID=UPI001AE003DF